MGHVDGDVYSYDQALDEQEDSVEKTHVLIDPSSAIIISAFMQERPFQPVTLDEIDPEETALMAKGVFGEDFEMIDRVMSAAGQKPSDQKGLTDGDGVFTPDERSKLAESQPRDATGLFVKTGSRVVIAGDTARGSGVLESIDHKNKKVNVKLDSGRTIAVDPKLTKPESKVKPVAPVGKPQGTSPAVNMSGILGNTKDKTKREKARLPEGMTTLGKKDIANMLDTWSKRVDIASKARPGDGKNVRKERNYIIQDGKLVEQEGRKVSTQKPESKAPAKESERIDQARRSKLQEKEGPKVPVQESQRIDQARGSKLKEKEGPKVPTTSGDGTYVVKKNDSLWSIAEKTKAAGQSTEDQWLKILEANKGKLRSDDPNLIFPDEKISIPNQKPVSAQEKIRAAKQADTKNNKGRK
jgi:LysM repeat protein